MSKIWPKEVPILVAEDFCKGDFQKGSRCCLMGWTNKVFGGTHGNPHGDYMWMPEVQEVVRTISEVANISKYDISDEGNIAKFNDAKENTRKILAFVWNKAMHKLGYNVPKKYLKV